MGNDYKASLNQRYWGYQKSQFPNGQGFFDPNHTQAGVPPVFITSETWRNIIINPNATNQEKDKLIGMVPAGERHKWFRSMNSSQALAQSVFGNLAVYDSLQILSKIKDDDGLDLFGKAKITSENFVMEYKVNYLGEPHPTSLDGFVSGKYRVAIECKFTEQDIGTCSRPRLTKSDSNYESSYCDGSYKVQGNRKNRCSLTESGVLYWSYIPSLFEWKSDTDICTCPVNRNYQLVRNILAAGVNAEGDVSEKNGHAVFIYDDRNPAFQNDGAGLNAYLETKKVLRKPSMLRKCSWQHIVKHLREKKVLPWLTDELASKYGF